MTSECPRNIVIEKTLTEEETQKINEECYDECEKFLGRNGMLDLQSTDYRRCWKDCKQRKKDE